MYYKKQGQTIIGILKNCSIPIDILPCFSYSFIRFRLRLFFVLFLVVSRPDAHASRRARNRDELGDLTFPL